MLTKDDLLYELESMDKDGELLALNFQAKQLKHEIAQLKDSLKDNKQLLKFIENLGLTVMVDGKKVTVTRKNIATYQDNQDYIQASIKMKQRKMAHLEQQIEELRSVGKAKDEL